jgi:hypothetical protein
MFQHAQVTSGNVVERDWIWLSPLGKDRRGAASLHCLFFGHFLQFRRSHSLGMIGAHTDTAILQVLEKNFASVGFKSSLIQEALDALVNPTR